MNSCAKRYLFPSTVTYNNIKTEILASLKFLYKEKAVTLKNTKCVYSQAMDSTEHITMLCGASAAGSALPPMIIYPGSFPGGQYRLGGPDDTLYAKSESGWVDSDLFSQWF